MKANRELLLDLYYTKSCFWAKSHVFLAIWLSFWLLRGKSYIQKPNQTGPYWLLLLLIDYYSIPNTQVMSCLFIFIRNFMIYFLTYFARINIEGGNTCFLWYWGKLSVPEMISRKFVLSIANKLPNPKMKDHCYICTSFINDVIQNIQWTFCYFILFFENYIVQRKRPQYACTLTCMSTRTQTLPLLAPRRTEPADLEIHEVTTDASLSTRTSPTTESIADKSWNKSREIWALVPSQGLKPG